MMSHLMRWTLIFAALLLSIHPAYAAWNIGGKGRVTGPAIHTTYFLTPNNQSFPIQAQAYVGLFLNGVCVYNTIYNMGTETFKTGEFFDIDAFALKAIIGTGYNCITIFYTYKQVVTETFQLFSDGFNYTVTNPPTAEVNIL